MGLRIEILLNCYVLITSLVSIERKAELDSLNSEIIKNIRWDIAVQNSKLM